jgi:hypothetical protein
MSECRHLDRRSFLLREPISCTASSESVPIEIMACEMQWCSACGSLIMIDELGTRILFEPGLAKSLAAG